MKAPHPYEQFDIDESLSYRIFKDTDGIDWNNKVIYRSALTFETPDTEVFPADVEGVTFIYSNLDNVVIPPGVTLIDCSNTRYEAQNDLNDWIIDEEGNPQMPVNFQVFEKLGLPIPNPKDIPTEKVTEVVNLIEEAKALELDEAVEI